MQTKLATAVLSAFVLLTAAACGGGGDSAKIAGLEADLAAVEAEAAKKAAGEEAARKTAEAAAAKAAEDKKTADAAAAAAATAIAAAEKAKAEAEERLTKAEQAELRARASSFGAHLDGPTAGPVTVTWPRGGSLTFRPQGTHDSGSAAPSVPGGWQSSSFTGQSGMADGLINEAVYLYTNIQTPGTRAFWKVHGLSIDTMNDVLAPFARGSSATPDADTESDTAGRQYSELTVSGSLSGASGNFACSACAGTVGDTGSGIDTHVTFAQGAPTFVNIGGWSFTPTNIANGYRVDEDDAYLYFGIWSSIPDSITGTYDFEYVAGGGAEPGSGLENFDALTGSATFRGGAVGKYVTQGQVGQQNAKIGSFTATATLNADFGADNAGGTLSGSITKFREGGSPLAGWRVTLGSAADVGAASDIISAAARGSTVADIGGLGVGGSWGAIFYGSDNKALDDRAKYPATRYPPVDLAGVAGWFDATGLDASLAGAFAATPSN